MTSLIVFDIDGTLIPKETHTLAEETRAALLELKSRDILLAVASGRQFSTIQEEIKAIGFDFYLCANGSCITDGTGLPIRVFPFTEAEALGLTQDAIQRGMSMMFRYIEGGVQVNPNAVAPGYGSSFFSNAQLKKLQSAAPPTIAPGELPYAGLCHLEEDDLEYFQQAYPGLRFTVTAGGELCDINRMEVSKGSALCFLADYLQIPMEETMGMGDDRNDIELIRNAGIGIAMGNAVEDVKAAANYITTPCLELGVVNALRHYQLIHWKGILQL